MDDENDDADLEPVDVDAAEVERLATEEEQEPMDETPDIYLSKVGTKKDLFNLRLQANHRDYGATVPSYGSVSQKFISWGHRSDMAPDSGVLLREHDALFCEFDENVKAYYFGDTLSRWDHARWNTWNQFIHPEYEASQQVAAEKRHRGISLQDCLDEFTKVGINHRSVVDIEVTDGRLGGATWRG
jgi:ubiquitin carboxyl-terminal hydrolase 4/11/15